MTAALAAVAILAAGLHRLPASSEMDLRYRVAGLPTRLSGFNPSLLAALDAQQPRLAYEFARMECAGSARGLARQFADIICTLAAEVAYSGDSLRLWWLNTTYFGRAAFGVSAGAANWFGKNQHDLTPAEATLLVALVRHPSADEDRLRRVFDRLADRMQIPEDARNAAMAGIATPR